MSRSLAAVLVVAVVSVLPSSAARAAESPTAEQARRAAEVRKKLAATVNFSGADNPETKFEEVLDQLSKLSGITFEINEQAFKDEQVDNVREKPMGRALPKMTDVSVEAVLRRLLARVPTTSGSAFLVRGGTVEVTTRRAASPLTWQEAPEVTVEFDKRPLQEAL